MEQQLVLTPAQLKQLLGSAYAQGEAKAKAEEKPKPSNNDALLLRFLKAAAAAKQDDDSSEDPSNESESEKSNESDSDDLDSHEQDDWSNSDDDSDFFPCDAKDRDGHPCRAEAHHFVHRHAYCGVHHKMFKEGKKLGPLKKDKKEKKKCKGKSKSTGKDCKNSPMDGGHGYCYNHA